MTSDLDGADDDGDAAEEVLHGGFSTRVVRKGSTVRRTASPWTPTVHALLRHLRASGVTRVPRPLGFDEQGREVLEHVEGSTAWWPWPEPLRSDAGLVAVAQLVRELGEALATFVEPPDAVWHSGPAQGSTHQRGLVVRHGDLAPWNTVWRGGRLVALIDWDTAEPAPQGWDAAQAAATFVPLGPMTRYRAEHPVPPRQVEHRFALWCAEVDVAPERLLDLVEEVQRYERDRIAERGARGVEPYATFLARGDVEVVDAERAWLAEHRERLVAAARAWKRT